MDLEIQRNDHEYFALVDGAKAHLDFIEPRPHVLDFQHTKVPPELRGRGIADTLVRHALDDAKARGYTVIPTCPFVQRFLEHHPEYRAMTTG